MIYCDTNDIGNIVGFWQLWSNDQLSRAVQSGQVFRDFEEGPLMFPPTYKYDVGTDKYDTRLAPAPHPALCLVVIRSFSTPVGISSSKVGFHDLKYPWLR